MAITFDRRPSVLAFLLLPLIASLPAVGAQCPTATSMELLPGCSTPNAPMLAVTAPVIGGELIISVMSIFPNAHGGLIVSLPPPLPYPVFSGCPLYVDVLSPLLTLEFFTDAQGDWSLVVPLPNENTFAGTTLHVQASIWALGGPINDDYLTQGIAVRIGCETQSGQGCTPGYWKQPHHAASWPAPHMPGTSFSAVFDDAFPGMTLVEVLALEGGGLNALGRHAVAALLNATLFPSQFGLTPSQVITLFNGVYPGTNQAYEALKDILEDFNTDGCPL